MKNMAQALDDVPIEEPARSALREFFERSSTYMVNAGEARGGAEDEGAPRQPIEQELCRRWRAQRTQDEAVAAIRAGAADRAIALAESSALRTYVKGNRPVLAALLARMIVGGDGALLDYAREKLKSDPALAQIRYSGRTLLHAAAAAGQRGIVELLLRLGAEPDVADDGGHTPLYSAANECPGPGGAGVVRALAQAGARVNACGGVKRCTALHMAARRDNREIAEALLECGAEIEARDSLGETPLRRAVNCNQTGVAELLVARGADIHSEGSKGQTPLSAARTGAMRRLLQPRIPK